MPMQIAGPSNRANPLHIVLPTCLRPFRTTIRNRPATQAAAQAIEPARLLLLSERRGPISRVGNIKPRVGMSILHASIQITIPRAHRRRLSSILKTPSRRRGSAGYFSYQTNGLPHLTHGVRAHIIATQQKTTRKMRPAKKPKPAENATMGPSCREIVLNCQKTPQGGLFFAPYNEQSDTATAKPQVANIFNVEFPISSEQHACNEAPLWHFLAETTQQDATQGRMGGRQSVYQATDGTRIISPARPQPEPTRAPNRKRHSYVSAHPSPKHLDREAAPAQPAFRTPGISHIAHQAASGTPTPRPPSR